MSKVITKPADIASAKKPGMVYVWKIEKATPQAILSAVIKIVPNLGPKETPNGRWWRKVTVEVQEKVAFIRISYEIMPVLGKSDTDVEPLCIEDQMSVYDDLEMILAHCDVDENKVPVQLTQPNQPPAPAQPQPSQHNQPQGGGGQQGGRPQGGGGRQ